MAYTDQQRQQAVDLYTKHGTAEASRQTGISKRTINRWAREAGVVAHDIPETAIEASRQRTAMRWADFRESEATYAGGTAAHARRQVLTLLDEIIDAGSLLPRAEAALRAAAITYGIFIDKAELLSGNATHRIESVSESELDRDLQRLVQEMENRVREEQAS